MQAGLDGVWPLTGELFQPHEVESRLVTAGVAADPAALRAEFTAVLDQVVEAATLCSPAETTPVTSSGRDGMHSDELVAILDEMQGLARSMPGSTW
jgi:ring-1,2-phenylacetyl-CoA epoxidase subunit PaaC